MFDILKKGNKNCIERAFSYIILNPEGFFNILDKIKEEVERGGLFLEIKPQKLEDCLDIPDELKGIFKVFSMIDIFVNFSEPIVQFTPTDAEALENALVPEMKEIKEQIKNKFQFDDNFKLTFLVVDAKNNPEIKIGFKPTGDKKIHFVYTITDFKRIKNLIKSLRRVCVVEEIDISKVKGNVPKLEEVDGKYEKKGEEEKEFEIFFFRGALGGTKLRMKVYLIKRTENKKYLTIVFYNPENDEDNALVYFGAI